jgi:hypothetical protein
LDKGQTRVTNQICKDRSSAVVVVPSDFVPLKPGKWKIQSAVWQEIQQGDDE